MADPDTDLLTQLGALGADAVLANTSADLVTTIGTVPLHRAGAPRDQGAGLLELLGVKAGVRLTDAAGRVVYDLGEIPQFDPLRAALLALPLVFVGVVVVRGVLR